MNENQNNNINGIITPTPITPTDVSNQAVNSNTNNLSQPTPIVPVEQTKEVNNNVETLQPNIISGQQTPNIMMPEMKKDDDGVSNNTNGTISQTQELKLDGTNPFDIGINQTPIMTSSEEQNVIQPTISNDGNTSLNNTQNDSAQLVTPVNNEQPHNINLTELTSNNGDIVPVSKYLINIILFSIPVVGFIILILRAMDKKNKNISNFAKAYLLLMVISVVLLIVFFGIFGAALLTFGNG